MTVQGAHKSAFFAGAAACGVLLAGCAASVPAPEVSRAPTSAQFGAVETRLLDGDLVNFLVSYQGDNGQETVAEFSECAAAQYTQIRGFGFAQHVRTKVSQEAGIWRAAAVYTISPALPEGLRQLDAEVVLANCRDNGIPTV